MLRSRRRWFVLLAGLGLAASCWVWAMSTSLQCTDIARIKIGMTRDEISAVLGKPPDLRYELSGLVQLMDTWEVSDGSITVEYDIQREVDRKSVECLGVFETQWRRLHRWWRNSVTG